MGKTLIRSILAGISISIGALIFLTLKQISLPFSAIFFTVGLLIILWYGFDLYTGKIGYLASIKDVPRMLLILVGNFIGCCIMFTFAGGPVGATAAAIMVAKYELNLFEVFIRAIICGILIYVAVD
jgi:formate/nitrite transporter FocA (FNT family)